MCLFVSPNWAFFILRIAGILGPINIATAESYILCAAYRQHFMFKGPLLGLCLSVEGPKFFMLSLSWGTAGTILFTNSSPHWLNTLLPVICLNRLEECSSLYQHVSQFREKNISFKAFGPFQSSTSVAWHAVVKMWQGHLEKLRAEIDSILKLPWK